MNEWGIKSTVTYANANITASSSLARNFGSHTTHIIIYLKTIKKKKNPHISVQQHGIKTISRTLYTHQANEAEAPVSVDENLINIPIFGKHAFELLLRHIQWEVSDKKT